MRAAKMMAWAGNLDAVYWKDDCPFLVLKFVDSELVFVDLRRRYLGLEMRCITL